MFVISMEKTKLDAKAIHTLLNQTYWAKGISEELAGLAIANSICCGAYLSNGKQIGFARLVTDLATFGYLCDVVVAEQWRGMGIGKSLTATLLEQPFAAQLRRIVLATKDAHTIYAPFGFQSLGSPKSFMEIYRPEIYSQRYSPNSCHGPIQNVHYGG